MTWYNVNLNKSNTWSYYHKQVYIDLQNLYKKYLAGELGGTQRLPQQPPECESTFCDNFETSWFSLNTYVSQFSETFEQQWFTNNNFVNKYDDSFEGGWFMFNDYLGQWFEGFEGEDWNEI